jgi:hypothetical protein
LVLIVYRKVESIQQVRCTDTVVIMLLGINVGSPSQVELMLYIPNIIYFRTVLSQIQFGLVDRCY